MFLPEQYKIEIATAKLNEYLLNRSHPFGWSKANYFFGHAIESMDVLQKILIDIISRNKVIKTEFGRKYIVDGMKEEFNVSLRTVWVVLKGENSCKLLQLTRYDKRI